ncbi:MAG: serine hydrolase [Kofleriaceae bacterium]
MRLILVAAVAACGGSAHPVTTVKPGADGNGAHKDQVAALVQPYVDAQITPAIVIGLYDAGHSEIYGFGKQADGAVPNGNTLFEIGAVTQIYTATLLADAVQKREIALDTELSELVPAGVTVPSTQGKNIQLGQLATHTSGLPPQPPSLVRLGTRDDPYGRYTEDALYADLTGGSLHAVPGTTVNESMFGYGVLGFVVGRKLKVGYQQAVTNRVLAPLALQNTYFKVPDAAKSRRAIGTDLDLKPVPNWSWDAMAGAGGLVSTAADQLAMIDAELDAFAGSKQTLRPAIKLTQEEQLPLTTGPNEGLGWDIDSEGRYWKSGSTGGFRSFVGFDPKTRRGVVILSASGVSLIEKIASDLYKSLAKEEVKPFKAPPIDELAVNAGTYQLGEFKVVVAVKDNRVYITGQGEAPLRLIPLTDHEMWFEQQQSIVVFEKEGAKVVRAVFLVGANRLAAQRVD